MRGVFISVTGIPPYMAYRFVRAQPIRQRLSELRERLDSGEIGEMEPFGQAITKALENVRFDPETGEAV